MNKQSEQACMICEQEKSEGIRICGRWICAGCEEEIVLTDVQDPKYPYFIQQLTQAWFTRDAL